MSQLKAVLFMAVMAVCFFQTTSSLRIGSFNIQAFGWKKMRDQSTMDIIKKIIKRYDIVFIQEIRDSTEKLLPSLVKELNYHSSIHYKFAISEFVGRSSYKEQYAFIYRTNEHIKLVHNYTYDDGREEDHNDLFSREPFVANFDVPCSEARTMTLVGIHISPQEAVQEIKLLQKVHDSVVQKFHSSNVVIMGDMNADCGYVPESKWMEIPIRLNSDFLWPICDDVDTTVKTTHCAYDRFIVGGKALRKTYIPGYAKAYRFDKIFSLSQSEAEVISDHYPIEILFADNCRTHKTTSSVDVIG